MTRDELKQCLESTGMPVIYRRDTIYPKPPYLIYLFSHSSDLMADGQNYLGIDNYQIELYTKNKDPATEKLVESKLKELGLPYSKTETFVQSEGLFQLVYDIQLIGG